VTTRTDRVFAALSDPTRRQLLEWLDEEVATATSFADRLPISRQAVAKHLSELNAAGLVSFRREGRETLFSVDNDGLAPAAEWLAQRAAVWETRLGRLAETARSGTKDEQES
jgi:DNA-binding transcriptional ArsR family regulator